MSDFFMNFCLKPTNSTTDIQPSDKWIQLSFHDWCLRDVCMKNFKMWRPIKMSLQICTRPLVTWPMMSSLFVVFGKCSYSTFITFGNAFPEFIDFESAFWPFHMFSLQYSLTPIWKLLHYHIVSQNQTTTSIAGWQSRPKITITKKRAKNDMATVRIGRQRFWCSDPCRHPLSQGVHYSSQ